MVIFGVSIASCKTTSPIPRRSLNPSLFDELSGEKKVFAISGKSEALTTLVFLKNGGIEDKDAFLCDFARQAISETSLTDFESIKCQVSGWSIRKDGVALLELEASDMMSFQLYYELSRSGVEELNAVNRPYDSKKIAGQAVYKLRYTSRSSSIGINAALPLNENENNTQFLIFRDVENSPASSQQAVEETTGIPGTGHEGDIPESGAPAPGTTTP